MNITNNLNIPLIGITFQATPWSCEFILKPCLITDFFPMLSFEIFQEPPVPAGESGGPFIPAFPPVHFQTGHEHSILLKPVVVTILELLKKRSEEHTSELQSRGHLVCRLLLEKK